MRTTRFSILIILPVLITLAFFVFPEEIHATAAPGTPNMTAATDTGSSNTDNITSDATPDFTISCTTGATVTLYYDGTASVPTGTCASNTVTITSSTLSSGTHSMNAKQTVSGVTSSASSSLSITIDITAPTIAQVTAVPTPTNDNTPNYTFSSTETGNITYSGGCSSSTVSASSGNNTITFNTLTDGTYSNCQIQVTDTAGNTSALLSVNSFTVDTTAPTVSNVTSSLADGSYKAGQVIPIQVNFSEIVKVTGTPQLKLSTGNPATTTINYSSGSGTSSLTFNYTVAATNTSADLDYYSTSPLTLNGGTIKDVAGNNATLTPLASPGTTHSLGANKNLVIDTTAPTIAQVTAVPTLTNDNTPNYTFSSTETGNITYSGGCSSSTVSASSGNNTITFNTLTDGTYSNCQIQVTDTAGNTSALLSVNSFTVDTTAPSGGYIDFEDGYYSTPASIVLYCYPGPDDDLNGSSEEIQRATATLSAGTCGSFGSFSNLMPGGNNNYTDNSNLIANNCYEYQFLVSDNAGNATIYTSTNIAKIVAPDSTPPTTTASATAGGSPYTFGNLTGQSVVVTLTCDDGLGSGCSGTIYCTDTTNTCTPWNLQYDLNNKPTITNQGTTYFRFFSVDNVGNAETVNSKVINIAMAPDAPTGLTLTVASSSEIDLSWTAPANYGGNAIQGYEIERQIGAGSWSTLIANTGNTNTTYNNTGLTAGTQYTYRVSAINGVGTGNASTTATAIAQTTPDAPTELTLTVASFSEIDLSWTAPANYGGNAIQGYEIERQIGAGSWSTLIANTGNTNTTYNNTGLTAGTQYTYRVSAINGVGTGNASSQAQAQLTETFPFGIYCSAGTNPNPLPTSPPAGSSTTWTCGGQNGGIPATCTATRAAATTATPPQVTLMVETPYYCSNSNSISFGWTYYDPSSYPEKKFDFQIEDKATVDATGTFAFNSPEVDRRICGSFSNSTNNQSPFVYSSYPTSSPRTYCTGLDQYATPVATPDALIYGQTYYWRVRVYNNQGTTGTPSVWYYGTTTIGGTTTPPGNSFTTASHAWPSPSFSFLPSAPLIKQPVTFTDSSNAAPPIPSICYSSDSTWYWYYCHDTSTCYNNVGATHACPAPLPTITYGWWFVNKDNINPDATTTSPPPHTYNAPGPYTTKLQICDSSVGCCSATGSVTVKNPLSVPTWKEISPF